jgi:hypothetical protein
MFDAFPCVSFVLNALGLTGEAYFWHPEGKKKDLSSLSCSVFGIDEYDEEFVDKLSCVFTLLLISCLPSIWNLFIPILLLYFT